MFCTFCGTARHNNDGQYCRSCGKLDPANRSAVVTEIGIPAIAASPAVSVLASSPQRDAPLPSPPALRFSYVPWTCGSCGVINMPGSSTCECGEGYRPGMEQKNPSHSEPIRATPSTPRSRLLGLLGVLSGAVSLFLIAAFFKNGGSGYELGVMAGFALVWGIIPLLWRKARWAAIIALCFFLLAFLGNLKLTIERDPEATEYTGRLALAILFFAPAVLSFYLFRKANKGR